MVSLLYAVAAAGYLCKLACKGAWKVWWKDGNELMPVGHIPCKFIVEEGTGEVEVT